MAKQKKSIYLVHEKRLTLAMFFNGSKVLLMRSSIKYSFFILMILMSFYSLADEQTLNIDRQLPINTQLSFPNPDRIAPQRSDFEVISAVPMSSDSGDRWVLLTMHNLALGNRTLTQNHLLAILADGNRVFPAQFSQRFKADETISLSIFITSSKFPILQVISDPN